MVMNPCQSSARMVMLLTAFFSFAACNREEGLPDSAGPSSASPTPQTQVPAPREVSTPKTLPVPDSALTTCRHVVPPTGGFGEGDFGIDPSRGTVVMHFSDMRQGRYRNVEHVIAYRDDPTCRTSPEVARLLDRLDPPGWKSG